MDMWTLTLVIVVICGIYYYFKRKCNYFEEYGIPYSPGLPVVGCMKDPLLRRKHFGEVVREIYNSNPDAKYVGAFDFTRPVIVLRDLELIKSIAIKHFDDFPDHKSFIDDTVDPLFGGNLFNMAGERWKEARNLLTPAFTSSKMKGMFELMIVCGRNFVDYLLERSEEENKMVASKDLFTKYTNDVIATCAFGVQVNSLKDPKNDFYVLGREATNLEGLMTLKFFIARAMPNLLKWLNIKFVNDRCSNFFKNIVETTIKYRDENKVSRPDMLQLMMNARGKENKHLKLDITEMTAQVFIFFFGGFDTTSTQMCSIAHELALNPDIQSRLQDEIDEVWRATNGNPTYEAINGMQYLDAVFNESLRLHTQGALLDRLCIRRFELPPALPGGKSFTVEPGMNIWIPGIGIHRDPQYYENPNKFDPDRYYQKKVTINDVTNLAFGIGPRSCIGNRFAILETKILFFFLLSKCNVKPSSKTCNPYTYSKSSFSTVPEGGFWIAIEPRT